MDEQPKKDRRGGAYHIAGPKGLKKTQPAIRLYDEDKEAINQAFGGLQKGVDQLAILAHKKIKNGNKK